MVVALERRIDRKITRRILAVFCAGFGSAEGDRNEMDATPVSWRKRERESFELTPTPRLMTAIMFARVTKRILPVGNAGS
jgi:hypothetical protein